MLSEALALHSLLFVFLPYCLVDLPLALLDHLSSLGGYDGDEGAVGWPAELLPLRIL